jgi:geranylgeranyl pyrophosphate synthase
MPVQLDGLALDRQIIDHHLAALLPPLPESPAPRLREAMRYAVFSPGRRVRPILALRISHMLGAFSRLTLRAAAAVELLHCASLIVDDLPCMDNDPTRRNRPSLHVAFGEATAVLASFGLVSLAARSAIDGAAGPAEQARLLDFQLDLLSTLDCASLIGGQSLDLALSQEARNSNRARLAALKTVPLFELAVRAGAISAELSPSQERSLLAFGTAFGIAYQMRDDHHDGEVLTSRSAASRFARALNHLAPFGPRAQSLRDLIEYLVS